MRSALDRAGINYAYVNIRQDEAARARVREINGGCESVPTLVFPDGSTLTEPSTSLLNQKLGLVEGQSESAPREGRSLGRPFVLVLGLMGMLGVVAGLLLQLEAAEIVGCLGLLGSLGLGYAERKM